MLVASEAFELVEEPVSAGSEELELVEEPAPVGSAELELVEEELELLEEPTAFQRMPSP